jgi:hypothetical protein
MLMMYFRSALKSASLSLAGSSACAPCPSGTYNDTAGMCAHSHKSVSKSLGLVGSDSCLCTGSTSVFKLPEYLSMSALAWPGLAHPRSLCFCPVSLTLHILHLVLSPASIFVAAGADRCTQCTTGMYAGTGPIYTQCLVADISCLALAPSD